MKNEELTHAEVEVLRMIASSNSSKEIARRRGTSPKTVGRQRGTLMRKLDLHDVAALTRYALGNRMIRNEYDPDFILGSLDMSQ